MTYTLNNGIALDTSFHNLFFQLSNIFERFIHIDKFSSGLFIFPAVQFSMI